MKSFDNLKLSLKIYSDNFVNLFLVTCLPTFLYTFLFRYQESLSGVPSIILYFVLVFFSSLISLLSIFYVQNINKSILYSLKHFLKYFFPSIILNIFILIIVISGYISFITPGIIFTLIFQFITYVYLDNKKSIIKSITLTRFYTQKKLKDIFLNSLFIGLFYFIYFSLVYSLVSFLKIDSTLLHNFAFIALINSLITPIQIIFFNNLYLVYKEDSKQYDFKEFPKYSKLIAFSIIFSSIAIISVVILTTLKIVNFFN